LSKDYFDLVVVAVEVAVEVEEIEVASIDLVVA